MRGIYLTEPHGELIWKGEKTLIVKSKRFTVGINEEVYLCSGDLAYGKVVLHDSVEINLEEFARLRPQHRITEEERKTWWGDQEKFYAYSFDFKRFEKPKKYKYRPGVQTWIEEVEFEKDELSKLELRNVNPVTLRDLSDEDLLGLHIHTHNRWDEFKAGKIHDIETIINSHILIVQEMRKRAIEHPYINELDDKSEEFQPGYAKQLEKAEEFSIQFLGTKGEIEEETEDHKYHSSVMVKAKGETLLIGYGEKQKEDLSDIKYDYLILTHAHPDHAFGIYDAQVWMSENPKNALGKKIEERNIKPFIFKDNEPFKLGIFKVTPISVLHSIKAPAVIFKIDIDNLSLIYASDVLSISSEDRYEYLNGVNLYIADGSSLTQDLVRRKDNEIFGHASIKTQLNWCRKNNVDNIIITHLGKELILMTETELLAQIKRLAGELNVQVAKDFQKFELDQFKKAMDKNSSLLFEHEKLHREEPNEATLLKHIELQEKMKDLGLTHLEKEGSDLDEMAKTIYAPIGPSGSVEGEEIKLEEVLPYFKSFGIRKPFLYLVGGLVTRGKTNGDIDILIKSEPLPPSLEIPLKFRIFRMLPKQYWNRIHFMWDFFHGPFTPYVELGDLEVNQNEERKVVQMSLKKQRQEERFAEGAFKQGQESMKEDRVELFRFFFPLKPTRGYLPEMRQTIDNFLSFWKPEDWPVFSSKKYDGVNCIIFKKGDKVQILSEQGEDNTDRYPTVVKEIQDLNAEELALLAEFEYWDYVDSNLKHKPREVAIGYAHAKIPPDDKNTTANVYDIVYFKAGEDRPGDIHKKPFSERLEYLDKLNFSQATVEVPDPKIKLNKAPHILTKDVNELREQTEKLRKLPGSEGQVAKRHDFIYKLDGSKSGMVKFHNSAVFPVMALNKKETKVKGVFNYIFGLGIEDEKVFPRDLVSIDNKKFIKVDKTFSSARDIEKGATFELECETLNLELNQKTGEIRMGAWAPRFLRPLSEAKPSTIKEAIDIAKRELVFVQKEITPDGEMIIKMSKIQNVREYDPSKMRDDQLRDDWRILCAWTKWKMEHNQW